MLESFAQRTKNFMKENPRILENAVRNNIEESGKGLSFFYSYSEVKSYDHLDLMVVFYYTFSETSGLRKKDFLANSLICSLAEAPDNYVAAKIANNINKKIYEEVYYNKIHGVNHINHEGILKTLARNLFYQTNTEIKFYEDLFSYDVDVEIENPVTISDVQAYWETMKAVVN